MKKLSKVILGILAALYCYLFVRNQPWEAFMDTPNIPDMVLASSVTVILTGLVVCALLLISGRKGARNWFIVLNIAYLVFGAYITQIAWTLWIFKTPTFFDRIKASAGPFLLGVVLPIAVVVHFLKAQKHK